jgi:hypothetical protein
VVRETHLSHSEVRMATRQAQSPRSAVMMCYARIWQATYSPRRPTNKELSTPLLASCADDRSSLRWEQTESHSIPWLNKLRTCTLSVTYTHSVLTYVGVRITAEWRGAAPTSGLGRTRDPYEYKPVPKCMRISQIQKHALNLDRSC